MKIVKSLAASLSMVRWEKTPQTAWLWSALWLIALCGVAFLWRLGSIGLTDETEPLFAEAARLMTVTGDWITPYFDGDPRFDKPPLIYWLMAIAYKILGVNEWAARLPSAIAATIVVVGCFLTLRAFGNSDWRTARSPQTTSAPRTDHDWDGDVASELESGAIAVSPPFWLAAWIGSAILAVNPHMIAWGRSGVSDMLLVCCLSAALMAFFWGYVQPVGAPAKPRWYLAFYIASALAVLTKGPVGLVLPGIILGGFLIYTGNLKSVLKEMQLLRGLGIILLLVIPWYALIIAIHGQDYIEDFFGYHNLERFTRVVNNHAAPWYFYVVVVLVGFMPWSLYLPLAIARLRFWRLAYWRQQPRAAQLGIFALFWFAGVFGFFTIAVTKLPSYMLPLIPAAAILVGLFWAGQMESSRRSRGVSFGESPLALRATVIVNVLLWVGLTGVTLYSPQWLGTDPAMPDLPYEVVRSGILIRSAAIWIAMVLAIAILVLRKQIRWVWVANGIGLVAFILLALMPASDLLDSQRQLPLRQLATSIVQYQQPSDEIILIGFKKPSLVFYSQRSVVYIRSPRRFIDSLRAAHRKKQPLPTSVLLVGQADKLTDIKLRLALPSNAIQILDHRGDYLLTRTDLSQMTLPKTRN